MEINFNMRERRSANVRPKHFENMSTSKTQIRQQELPGVLGLVMVLGSEHWKSIICKCLGKIVG